MDAQILDTLSHLSYLNAGIFLIVASLHAFAIYGVIAIARIQRDVVRALPRPGPGID
jgi:hypothetical protein